MRTLELAELVHGEIDGELHFSIKDILNPFSADGGVTAAGY